jgi:hypothetical protein
MAVEIPIGTPGTVRHDAFGDLSVDVKQQRRSFDGGPEVDVFSGDIKGTVQADGATVRINLTPELVTDLPSWVDRCAARVTQAIAGLESIKAHAADDHLAILNKHWLDDGEPPLSKADFMGRLRLSAVNFLDDEFMDVFFDDGDLFAGHSVIVAIEEDGTPGQVQLFG